MLGSSIALRALLCVMASCLCVTGNHCIQVYSVDGKFLHTLGSSGNGDGQFSGPAGVVVSAGGEVFVCENGGYCVQVFG